MIEKIRLCHGCAAQRFDWYYQTHVCFLKFNITQGRPDNCKKKPHSDCEMFEIKNRLQHEKCDAWEREE